MKYANKRLSITDKYLLTIHEAAALSGIGIHKLEEMTKNPDCEFVLMNGNRRLIKKDLFMQYLEQASSI